MSITRIRTARKIKIWSTLFLLWRLLNLIFPTRVCWSICRINTRITTMLYSLAPWFISCHT
jgi:hypothetical protein